MQGKGGALLMGKMALHPVNEAMENGIAFHWFLRYSPESVQ
ncbi:hypothetical protein B4168_3346 [Anoxybacillus flavithermus]|nr:hypothetical protein B4168_3346 [Anoxybacillus flavithermus]OAO85082.1 hypothetical protein GT23_3136 [Parageobacillus thermoglucosidasius]